MMPIDNEQLDISFPGSYRVVNSKLTGQLVKVKSPGMLLISESSGEDQIFDLGKKNTYLLVTVQMWHYAEESYLAVSLLYNSTIYSWRGVKLSESSIEEFLDERFELVEACN
tara:strand:+ start:505 stop:840 length:336 start_codon:yes stop_codon:yes gene_type:complete